MRVGIDVDYGDDKNLNRSQSRMDLMSMSAEGPLGGVQRVLDLLESVYKDTRSSLLAEIGYPLPAASQEMTQLETLQPEIEKMQAWEHKAREYRVLVADLLGVSGSTHDMALRKDLRRVFGKYRELFEGIQQLVRYEDDREYTNEEILQDLREAMGK